MLKKISIFTAHCFSVAPNHNAVNSGENMQLPANIIFLTVYKAPYVIKMTKNKRLNTKSSITLKYI